jgi:hypothetical protein
MLIKEEQQWVMYHCFQGYSNAFECPILDKKMQASLIRKKLAQRGQMTGFVPTQYLRDNWLEFIGTKVIQSLERLHLELYWQSTSIANQYKRKKMPSTVATNFGALNWNLQQIRARINGYKLKLGIPLEQQKSELVQVSGTIYIREATVIDMSQPHTPSIKMDEINDLSAAQLWDLMLEHCDIENKALTTYIDQSGYDFLDEKDTSSKSFMLDSKNFWNWVGGRLQSVFRFVLSVVITRAGKVGKPELRRILKQEITKTMASQETFDSYQRTFLQELD